MVMKKFKTVRNYLLLVLMVLFGCGEEGGLKGTLKISITDAPVDAENIKAVNIVITNVQGFQNGTWKSFKNFEQPVGINLIAYSGGKSILLIDQYASPGEFSSVRLSLNIANRNSSLIINPQSNVVLKDGSSAPLYMANGKAPEIVIEKNLGISSRGLTDITLDFDLRKSIRLNEDGEYVIDPVVRTVNTNKSGHIRGTIVNTATPKRVTVYAYAKGSFKSDEKAETSSRPAFYNAITSTAIKSESFVLAFLEPGKYDLIFAKNNEAGKVIEIIGMQQDTQVNAGETASVDIDVENLDPS